MIDKTHGVDVPTVQNGAYSPVNGCGHVTESTARSPAVTSDVGMLPDDQQTSVPSVSLRNSPFEFPPLSITAPAEIPPVKATVPTTQRRPRPVSLARYPPRAVP